MVEEDKNYEISQKELLDIKIKLLKSLQNYRKTMSYMVGDAPISVLCLSRNTEKVLLNNGLLRIYDLFDLDLTKIEGLNETGIRNLTSGLDQFLAMS